MAGDAWAECSVGDIAAAQRNALVGGPFGSDLGSADYVESGVPVIRGQNLGPDRWVAGEFVFVSDEKAGRLAANVARPGDLVFTQRGNAVLHGGQVAIVPPGTSDRFVVSQSQMKLTVDPARADAHFLYYVFKSPEHRDYLRCNAIVTGVPHTNLSLLREFPLRLPPVSVQRAIAGVLGALDDKIELNRRMNETLEAMARALFESWFVDFDPVRAKAEGWTEAGLWHWVTVLSGGTPSKSDHALWDGDIPWISPKVMTSIHADRPEEHVTASAIGNGTRLAPSGSTLVMVRGMGLHQRVRISQARGDVTFNQDVKALVPRGIVPSLLLFAMLDAQPDLLGRVQSSGHGTGVLPTDVLLAHPIAMPPLEAQVELARPFDALSDRIAVAQDQSRTLAALRDALLPRLVSGELRVRDAEQLTERTL